MFERFRTSGYLKTSIISLVIIAAAVGAVAVLDWRDNAAAPPAESTGMTEENTGQTPAGGTLIGQSQTQGGTTGQTGPAGGGQTPGGTTTFTPPGDGNAAQGSGMQVTRNPDGSFSVFRDGEPVEAEGIVVPGGPANPDGGEGVEIVAEPGGPVSVTVDGTPARGTVVEGGATRGMQGTPPEGGAQFIQGQPIQGTPPEGGAQFIQGQPVQGTPPEGGAQFIQGQPIQGTPDETPPDAPDETPPDTDEGEGD